MTEHSTPRAVQGWLKTIPYNWERFKPTMRSFRGVVRHRTAHCLEGALSAACILEEHGYPPLLLDLESRDGLDHVVFAFKVPSGWGAVGMSRDRGLWGRKPIFKTPYRLAMSYYEPFIGLEARILSFALVDLTRLGSYDWRLSERNVWKVERFLIDHPHRRLRTSDARYVRLRERYRAFADHHDSSDTPFTGGAAHWM